jgi:hemolysin activation/secretion protein
MQTLARVVVALVIVLLLLLVALPLQLINMLAEHDPEYDPENELQNQSRRADDLEREPASTSPARAAPISAPAETRPRIPSEAINIR